MSTIKLPNGEEVDEDTRSMFLILEHRYYAKMWFWDLPKPLSKFGRGGNVNGLLWRKDAEPKEWVYQFRWRHYKDEAIWDGDDEKSWYAVYLHDKTEKEAIEEVRSVMNTMLAMTEPFGVQAPSLHELDISGGFNEAQDAFQRPEAFWMHTQQQISA